jgi:quaternary ammonium compound-resistance protein SugE
VDVGPKQDSRTSTPYPDSDKTAFQEIPVYWLVLIVSGVLEAVWATALGRSEGFSRLTPTVVFAASLAASMAGLAYAMRGLPIGTAYAVWVGIGAALTAGYAMWAGQEPVSVVRVLLLAGIVGCVVGLKLTH